MDVEPDFADKLFEGTRAECAIESLLCDAGVPFDKLGWDSYDCSLEIYGVDAGYRMPLDLQSALSKAGFAKVYVNHVDKWETHYTFVGDNKGGEGWRVSYPHKRGDDEGGIWVESIVPSWPVEWFKSGYAMVKAALSGEPKQ